ncbi:MAG: SGNH/GDSL hydrolase family protein [Verrucomicrobiales bacterium]
MIQSLINTCSILSVLAISFPAWLSVATPTVMISKEANGNVRLSHEIERFSSHVMEASDNATFNPSYIVEQRGKDVLLPAERHAEFFKVRVLLPETRNYLLKTQIDSPIIHDQVDRWFGELRRLNLLNHVHYMSSFRSDQTRIGIKLPAMVGPDALANKDPSVQDGAVFFDGNLGFTFTNVFQPGEAAAISILAVFESKPGSMGLLIGQTGPQGRVGPGLWAGGSPYLGVSLDDLAFQVTSNGFTSGEPGFRTARTFNLGNTFAPQVTLATATPLSISIRSNIDRTYGGPSVHAPIVIIDGDWQVGRGHFESWNFQGKLHFLALFDAQISPAQYESLLLAYRKTLGSNIPFPRFNLVVEGDSLSEESTYKEYARFLVLSDKWKGKVFKKNIAKGGEGIDQMLAQFPTQTAPLYPGENWLFLWAGRNNIYGTADHLFNGLQDYWAKAKAAGYKVAAFTIIPAAYEATMPGISARRNHVNKMIREASSQYDLLIDLDALPELSDPKNLVYFHPDGVHLTEAAGRVIANHIATKLQP